MIPLLDLKAQYKTIQEEIKIALEKVLKDQHFILGEQVKELEEAIACYAEARYAVGVASGSDALLLSLMACDIQPGDEVITSPYTFFATGGAIARLGARPVFVDIDRRTYAIHPHLIEEKITPKTKAIIPVHLFGQCADMDPLMDIARRHGLFVIEDAAQTIGASYKGRKAGTIGDLGCFSFFPSKNLGGYGDGGMVVSNNEALAEKIRILRVHGSQPKYYHEVVGINSRLDTLQAAVLLVKLKYLDDWHAKRQEHARIYDGLFKEHDVETPYVEPYNVHIYNQYVIRVNRRDVVRQWLTKKDIGTEIYYPVPLHLQKCFAGLEYSRGDFPEAEKAAAETLALPIYPELTEEQQRCVAQAVIECVTKQTVGA